MICSLENVPMPQGQIHHVAAQNLKFSHTEHWSCLWERTLLGRQWSNSPMYYFYLCWHRTIASPSLEMRMERGKVV